ncbi:imidazole glycerol phosphate synthase subunit HisF [Acetobacterium wieringae]|uniref:Imidazole glycerol phosphate synthase subunit HisF n=1 Tax=Acetobacterium wieringae TaxID=52694 RepID=A0ABY6HAH6_9FIRM|nr:MULTISPECIES: imidazole glycerol phosphate synthase subunit HisF [Acetobacterium]OXS25592.1 MAG: imidazole glycerol phosphate synthase subunit HisF [Acetobacterium sp. MES1]UYO61458.1 imidazole glycerol phosphate synthase subunit HisF [Acetobacterium wieringae]VUZ28582.1 Imidazole glycerol phosphate synthase subunit HisF [Acetobacterium wieringae]
MLTKRIIPCLDVDHGRVVKGKKFQDIQDVADPVELGRYYSDQGADELVFYDITASYEDRDIFIHIVEKVAEAIRIPFTIGGGISKVEDFRKVLMAGADKVSVNSSAVKNPQLIREAALRFGAQCVVLSIDAKRNNKGSWDVYVKGGRENTGIDAIEWAKQGQDLGAGEICINSIDTDGVKKGYDLELNQKLSRLLTIPIIASGGAGKMEDFAEVLKVGADAALAASVFHYKEIPIADLKNFLHDQQIPVRRV